MLSWLEAACQALGLGFHTLAPAKETAEIENLPRSLPIFPPEIWRIILGYATRLCGAQSVDLPNPLSGSSEEDYCRTDPGFFQDRMNLSQVCSVFRTLVLDMSFEYLVIETGHQLAYVAKLVDIQKHLGEKIRRIDLQITGKYKMKHFLALIQHAPNLSILINRNNLNKGSFEQVPSDMVNALVNHGRSIQRLEFQSTAESPALEDLLDISRHLPKLETVHLVNMHFFPMRVELLSALPLLQLTNLKSLSLGLIPIPCPEDRETYPETWDPLLAVLCCDPTTQLPNLTRLEVDIFPTGFTQFFTYHGHKLRTLRTAICAPSQPLLPEALEACPNLTSLIITPSREVRINLPSTHPSIQRICIVPPSDERIDVPLKLFRAAAMDPLNNLLNDLFDNCKLPKLEEVRVRNTGLFSGLAVHKSWLSPWTLRWGLRGVRFVDKAGMGFKDCVSDDEALLNTIRL
ncbi:hypothetical protein CC2G_013669 [Coprinopsis cinerea AmutBmut pab1-1]|nr:hypothetical protein CC2G_013669 [Coprinopsis cinerea AmutBmut pab1-1]